MGFNFLLALNFKHLFMKDRYIEKLQKLESEKEFSQFIKIMFFASIFPFWYPLVELLIELIDANIRQVLHLELNFPHQIQIQQSMITISVPILIIILSIFIYNFIRVKKKKIEATISQWKYVFYYLELAFLLHIYIWFIYKPKLIGSNAIGFAYFDIYARATPLILISISIISYLFSRKSNKKINIFTANKFTRFTVIYLLTLLPLIIRIILYFISL